ncbi:hypothetical protein CEXT_66541 [Caerostris extrusa]|uniref:Uncharacterized protein n=1 Tax=Caerostris extrusa TaxID=172846 RepID=A0AAV4XSR1_CAEEX|nr:hypothetical protein CEXT_66541 [Caerostris extrusa]
MDQSPVMGSIDKHPACSILRYKLPADDSRKPINFSLAVLTGFPICEKKTQGHPGINTSPPPQSSRNPFVRDNTSSKWPLVTGTPPPPLQSMGNQSRLGYVTLSFVLGVHFMGSGFA